MVNINSGRSTASRGEFGLIPHRLILMSVGIVCLCLLGSAIYSFTTLLKLHTLYLSNRGSEIALSIESQARGGGRRRNPEYWQSLLEEKYASYSDVVAFLALIDRNGSVLASAGKPPFESNGRDVLREGEVYQFEETLGKARNGPGFDNSYVSGWRIRIGLYASDADFIRSQAWILLAVSGSAIAAMILMSLYLIRMLKRFVELKTRESSEAHLKSLGVMAASLAHEIRNPLGSMKGLTQLAQEELPREHATQGNLSTVVSEAERLERLVSDLLDFARPKEPQLGEFNLNDLVSDIKTMLAPRFADSGVSFECDPSDGPVVIRSDSGGIRQVLLNVLMNAMEATPDGGTVTLQTRKEEDGNLITIQVDDTGQGLDGRNAEDLFEPFVTTGTRGTGLGLTISRKIVQGLNGTLTLTDNPRGGMRCTIQLRQTGGGEKGWDLKN